MRTRFNYPFTRFLSLRAIVDYEAVVPNPPLSDEEHERKWSGDNLLTYLVNPGTAVHFGYIDQYKNVAIVAGPRALRAHCTSRDVGRSPGVRQGQLSVALLTDGSSAHAHRISMR